MIVVAVGDLLRIPDYRAKRGKCVPVVKPAHCYTISGELQTPCYLQTPYLQCTIQNSPGKCHSSCSGAG